MSSSLLNINKLITTHSVKGVGKIGHIYKAIMHQACLPGSVSVNTTE